MRELNDNLGLELRGEIGTETRDDLEIPPIVLREALVNAFMHRDYENQIAQPTKIYVYPDK